MQSTTKTAGKTDLKSTIRDAKTKSASNILHLLTIKNKASYEWALAVMEYLILNSPDATDNPQHDFMMLLSSAIETYENKHYSIPKASGVEVLRFLMTERGLKQVDLTSTLGTASLVSEVLNKKRKLNRRQIEALSKYFHVSPAVFFDGDYAS